MHQLFMYERYLLKKECFKFKLNLAVEVTVYRWTLVQCRSHLNSTSKKDNTNWTPQFQIHVLETPFLNINCGHLKTFDADLYRQLVCYPQEVIPTFDMAVNEVFFEKYPGAQLQHQIQVLRAKYFTYEQRNQMKGSVQEWRLDFLVIFESVSKLLNFCMWHLIIKQRLV